MISHKNILLSLAVVAVALVSSLCQAQKILTPQTPMNMPKPTATKPAPQRQEYRITGGLFWLEASDYGFNSYAHAKTLGSKCEVHTDSTDFVLDVGRAQFLPGSKCDFTLFEGQALKNGFVFKSYRGSKRKTNVADINITSSPVIGGTSIRFTFHGWDDPGNNEARYIFDQIVLEGPADREWRDALR